MFLPRELKACALPWPGAAREAGKGGRSQPPGNSSGQGQPCVRRTEAGGVGCQGGHLLTFGGQRRGADDNGEDTKHHCPLPVPALAVVATRLSLCLRASDVDAVLYVAHQVVSQTWSVLAKESRSVSTLESDSLIIILSKRFLCFFLRDLYFCQLLVTKLGREAQVWASQRGHGRDCLSSWSPWEGGILTFVGNYNRNDVN